MRILSFLPLLLLLFAGCGRPRSEQTLILFVGDSITSGAQAGPVGSGATYPEQAMRRLGSGYTSEVLAWPGKTAYWLLKHRLGVLDSVDDKGYKQKIATLFFVANDLQYPIPGASAAPDSVLNYNRQIANVLTARGYKVILCPALDRANYPEFVDFNAKRERYNEALHRQYKSFAAGVVALEKQPLIFARGATKNLTYFAPGEKPGQSDGSHPNAAGAALLGLEFAHAIEAVSTN